MKLLSFHLMPYSDLPPDFAETNDSVWVSIDGELFDATTVHRLYNDYLDELEYAAEVGLDGVCVNEHHANGYGMMASPNLMAAALARRTKDVAICILGNSLALYNPPIRVAEEMAMLDLMSGGRLISGFPVGSPMDTCYAYSMNPSEIRDRWYEAHDLIIKAWKERKPFDWNGRYYKMRDVNVWQKPVQEPHPPVWIPGGGSIETWEWSARRNYLYTYLSYFGYKLAQDTMRGYWNKIDELGTEPNPFRAGFLQFVGVAESKKEAMRLYAEPAAYFWNTCLHFNPRYTGPPGYLSESTIRAKVTSQVATAAAKADSNVSEIRAALIAQAPKDIEGFVEKGYLVLGSPDEVAEQLTNVAKDLRVGNLMTLLHFGNMDRDTTLYNMELFGTKVVPQIRHLWEDEWENHWWPKGIAPGLKATPRAVAQ